MGRCERKVVSKILPSESLLLLCGPSSEMSQQKEPPVLPDLKPKPQNASPSSLPQTLPKLANPEMPAFESLG